MKYKIYYINLDRSIDRKQQMETNLNKIFPDNFNRFSAVDKNSLTKDYIRSILDPRTYYYMELNNHKRLVNEDINSLGHIGCFLSHRKLWEMLINDNNTDYYIIFEDDVVIKDDFKRLLDELLSKYQFDFVSLGYTSRRNNDEKFNEDLYYIRNPFFGTQAYIVNKKAALSFYLNSEKLTTHVDAYLGYMGLYDNQLKMYLYKNSMVTTGHLASEIEHGNCIHCNRDDSFLIMIRRLPSKFIYYAKDKKGCSNILVVFILLLLLGITYKKLK